MSDDPLDILLDNAEAQIRVVEVVVILTDLIADMRHHVRHSEGEDHEYIAQAFRKGMTLFADRAEQRLREVQGER